MQKDYGRTGDGIQTLAAPALATPWKELESKVTRYFL